MSESFIAPAETAAALQTYESLVSPEGQQAFVDRMNSENAAFNLQQELSLVHSQESATEGRLKQLQKLAFSPDEPADYDTQIHDFSATLDRLEERRRAAIDLGSFQEERQQAWERHGRMTFDRHEAQAQPFIEQVVAGASRAEHPFVSADTFRLLADGTRPSVEIQTADEPLMFPLTAFVSAGDFSSWEQGRQGAFKDGRTSPEIIAEYASRDSELPAVDEAYALLLDSGQVVLLSSNAHRVAAAKLKGQAEIAVNNLIVQRAQANAEAAIDGN